MDEELGQPKATPAADRFQDTLSLPGDGRGVPAIPTARSA